MNCAIKSRLSLAKIVKLGVLLLLLALTRPSHAGDTGSRPAHETATQELADKFIMPAYPSGSVGGASNPALTLPPIFVYTNVGVADPDLWPCFSLDPDLMPPALGAADLSVAPIAASTANALNHLLNGVNMLCNWTHFSSNPAFGNDALATERIVRSWAKQLTDDISADAGTAGGVPPRYATQHFCDVPTWAKFVSRHNAANHYLQDNATVFHVLGNDACDPRDHFSEFSPRAQTCLHWVGDRRAAVVSGSLACDDEVAQTSGGTTTLSHNAQIIFTTCMNAELMGTGKSELSWLSGFPVAACAGLERLMRHHCQLNYPPLKCNGPGSNHLANPFYCEGEVFKDATGNDFMQPAEDASLAPTAAAAATWADVCQQPDYPCDPAACQRWCERSQTISLTDYTNGERAYGYCLKAPEDSACSTPHCTCGNEGIGFPDSCGQSGQPCCKAAFSQRGGCGEGVQCDNLEGLCKPCGGPGQQCCRGTSCQDGLSCLPGAPDICGRPTCQAPGAADAAADTDACPSVTCEQWIDPDPVPCDPSKGDCHIKGATCGEPDNGCGRALECGRCEAGTCNKHFNCEKVCHAVCPSDNTCPIVQDECDKPHQCLCQDQNARCLSNGTCCSPTTCQALGAICGNPPDGCGGTLNCGTCINGTCNSQFQCEGTCTALCPTTGCPQVIDSCGMLHQCGCANPTDLCQNGICCTRTTCAALGATCGTPSDGCGGTLNCGSCAPPQNCNSQFTCEGVCTAICPPNGCATVTDSCGKPHQCGTPTTCSALGATCGNPPDGCGGTLNCGSCTAPDNCNAQFNCEHVCHATTCPPNSCATVTDDCGKPHTCHCPDAAPICLSDESCCAPRHCGDFPGECGSMDDGCGGSLSCGCGAGAVCTSFGSCCTPDTCGGQCGIVSDGCDGTLDCGDCGGGGGGGPGDGCWDSSDCGVGLSCCGGSCMDRETAEKQECELN